MLPELPQQVRDFMEQVPLVVEDYPSPASDAADAGAASVASVRAVHGHSAHQAERRPVGRAVGRDSYLSAGNSEPVAAAGRPDSTRRELRKQIRRTILHEYGHHVGLTERDLRELGYG